MGAKSVALAERPLRPAFNYFNGASPIIFEADTTYTGEEMKHANTRPTNSRTASSPPASLPASGAGYSGSRSMSAASGMASVAIGSSEYSQSSMAIAWRTAPSTVSGNMANFTSRKLPERVGHR